MSVTLAQLLRPFFKRSEWQITLLKRWPEIIGPMHAHVRVEKCTGSTVVLGVYEAAWMHELYMMQFALIKTINHHLGNPYVKKITFKRVTKKETAQTNIASAPIAPAVKAVELSALERAQLQRIKDETLRKNLEQFLVRCHQTTKERE